MFTTLYTQLGAVAVVSVCLAAVVLGSKEERAAGTAALLAWVATLTVQAQTSLAQPFSIVIAIDLMLLAVLGYLSLRSELAWPIWAASCQAVGVAAHLCFAFDVRIGSATYFSAFVISSWGVLVALALGTFRVWRERRAMSYQRP